MSGHYVGVAACGCIRAIMVDDQDTTADEVAQFAKRQAQATRRLEYREELNMTQARQAFESCPHKHRGVSP